MRKNTSSPRHLDPTLTSPYNKLVTENERLKKDLKLELSHMEKLQQSLSATQLTNQKLAEELRNSKSDTSVRSEGSMREKELMVKVEELQAEVEKKTFMLMEVKRHLKELAEKEKHSTSNNSVSYYIYSKLPLVLPTL